MTARSTLNDLRGAVRLSFAGTAHVLTEYHDVPQPEADILALTAILDEIDAIADLPTLTLSDAIIAIRASVENTYNAGAEPEPAVLEAIRAAIEDEHEDVERDKWAPKGTPT